MNVLVLSLSSLLRLDAHDHLICLSSGERNVGRDMGSSVYHTASAAVTRRPKDRTDALFPSK